MTDAHAASELKLYIDNDGDLYRRQTTSILKNLVTKQARGEYKHDLAVKAFGHLVEAGAKKYAKEFGSAAQPWHKMFDAGTRKQAAEALTRDFEVEAALGNYDQLLPQKYQGQKSGVQHARKKISRGQHAGKKLQLRDKYGEPYGLASRVPGGARRGARAKKSGASTALERGGVRSGRVEILESGGSTYFKPGQFGYVVGTTSRGGMHTLDRGDSRVGEVMYLVSKSPKGAGGAVWFSAGGLRFTGRPGGIGPVLEDDDHYNHARRKSPAQLEHEIAQVIGTRRYRP